MINNAQHLPVFVKLQEEIIHDIKFRNLKPGDPIGSLRELSDTYDVSYVTAQKAVKQLIDDGLLNGSPGKIATVARFPDRSTSESTAIEVDENNHMQKGIVLVAASRNILENKDSAIAKRCQAVENALFHAGWRPFLCLKDNKEDIVTIIDENTGPGFMDGLIILDTHDDDTARALSERDFKSVFIDYVPSRPWIDCVTTNNGLIMSQVMDHFKEYGHNHIDFIGHISRKQPDRDSQEQEDRWRVLLDRMNGTGDSAFLRSTKPDECREYIFNVLNRPNPPTAIYSSSFPIAVQVSEICKEMSIEIPNDLSIASCTWDWGQFSRNNIDAVKVDFNEIARLAVARLSQLIQGYSRPGARLMHAGQLESKGSSGPAPDRANK